MTTIELDIWVARDKSNYLWGYKAEPIWNEEFKCYDSTTSDDNSDVTKFDDSWFPEVTYENSPVKMRVSFDVWHIEKD